MTRTTSRITVGEGGERGEGGIIETAASTTDILPVLTLHVRRRIVRKTDGLQTQPATRRFCSMTFRIPAVLRCVATAFVVARQHGERMCTWVYVITCFSYRSLFLYVQALIVTIYAQEGSEDEYWGTHGAGWCATSDNYDTDPDGGYKDW